MSDVAVVDSYPLTPLQQGMLFHHLEGTNVGVDIEQMVGDLPEPIDTALFERAWKRIGNRHPILRTRFRWAGLDQPVQEILDAVSVTLVVQDLRTLAPGEQQRRFDRFLIDDRGRGFELDQAPPWRVNLFRLADDRQRVVFTYHHCLLDVSVVWVVAEVFQTYDASVRGEQAVLEQRRPYKDHILWLQDHLVVNRDGAQRYFHQLLNGFDEPTNLDALQRSTRPEGTEPGYVAHRFRLTAPLSGAIHAFGATEGISPAVLVEAAWALVLSAFSGSDDVVFGSTRAAGGRVCRAPTARLDCSSTPRRCGWSSILPPRFAACSTASASNRSTSAPTSTRRSPRWPQPWTAVPARCSTPSWSSTSCTRAHA